MGEFPVSKTQAFDSPAQVKEALSSQKYIASDEIGTTVFLTDQLSKPLLLEGPAGVGKTELAKSVAAATGRELIRLQCYEGLDETKALYEWEYAKQLLYTQLLRDKLQEALAGANSLAAAADRLANEEDVFFSMRFLLQRPLLKAILNETPTVLLIDEIDRADAEFEAFLLEVLSDFQVTIPELGVIRAAEAPVVILTSNRTREIADALKRRCLYHWIDYPDAEKELAIVQARAPEAPADLARQAVAFVHAVRQQELYKQPGVAETLDWLAALGALDQAALAEPVVADTLGALLKTREDIPTVQALLPQLLAGAVG